MEETRTELPLDGSLQARLETLAATPRLLVALDFDGVLAPFTAGPGDARMLPESHRAIRRMAGMKDTWVALVSGRDLDSLTRVSDPPEQALLVGSHGVEVRVDGHTETLALDDRESAVLHDLDVALDVIVAKSPGARIERKPSGRAVHSRSLGEEETHRVDDAALAAARDISPDLTVRAGKDVVEFSVRDATKGDGILLLKERVSASGVFFAGDDVTDEDGFAVLGSADVGVKVGPGETLAGFRVADPWAIARTITLLADARACLGP